MPMPRPYRRRTAILVLLTLSGPAAAWTAYGEPPPADPAQDQSLPAPRAYTPYPAQPDIMPMPGYGMPRGFPPPGAGYDPSPNMGYPGAPGMEVPPGGSMPPAAGMGPASVPGGTNFEQRMTNESYILNIGLDGIDPSQVQVDTVGRALVVRTDRSAETRREESFDDGRGVVRSFSWSSGSSARRLPVPPDADLGALTREDSPDRVRIVIPRTTTAGAPAAGDQTNRP
jgi:hypothetical protein